MNIKNYVLSLLLLSLLCAGCNNENEKISPHAYFAGHIVNPTSEFLVIFKGITVLDTVQLDEDQNFHYKFENLEEGLYKFKHNFETQNIYLVPGDSLLAWVNTLEFDESLNFSGKGHEKNNLIIDLFLEDKKNTELVLDYYKIEPKEFAQKTDSIKSERIKSLRQRSEKNEFPESFEKVAEKMIEFEHYNLRERYAYMVNKYHPEFSDDFPQTFFAYREKAALNDEDFQSNPVYLRFFENYLINLSIKCCQGEPENNACYDLNDYKNIIKRIEMVDSLTPLPLLKNRLLKRLGTAGMVMGKNRDELLALLKALSDNGISEKGYRELVTLGNIQLAFIPGTNVGVVPLITPEQEEVRAKEIIDQKSVFYLWSIYSPTHHKKQHRTIRELRKKYRDIDFIGINIDIKETSAWINALRKYNYNLEYEYQLDSISIRGEEVEADAFKSYLNKLLFLNASGKVVVGDAYINSPDFESRILEFLNL